MVNQGSAAVDGHVKSGADVVHSHRAQRAEPFDEDRDRNALHRVEVRHASTGDGVVAGLEQDLARQIADRRGARSDQRSPEPGNGSIARKHHDWPSSDVRWFAPPHFAAPRQRRHVALAAARKEARSPHWSGSSTGLAP